MLLDERLPLAGGLTARIRFTSRSCGDLSSRLDDAAALERRRHDVVALPWASARQVHGDRVHVVTAADAAAEREGDALVTTEPGVVVSINTADCAPVALVGRGGVVAAVHAGWRGLVAGVVERAVEQMTALGAGPIQAHLGPCVHAECYEFGGADLDLVTARFGPAVEARTTEGGPALDVPAAVARALGDAGVPLVSSAGICTACAPRTCFSHRARGESQRHALAVWMEPADGG